MNTELKEKIRTLTNSPDFLSQIFLPITAEATQRLAFSLFGNLAYSKSYKGVTSDYINKMVKDLNLIGIYDSRSFDKESGDYIADSKIFINFEKKIIICVSSSDEEYETSDLIYGDSVCRSFKPINNNEEPGNDVCLLYVFYSKDENNEKWLPEMFDGIEKSVIAGYKLKVKKNAINFLCFSHGFRLKNVKIKRKTETDLELNYTPGFLKIHDHLFKFLESDETGLAILHGDIGSGKTSYIRYLLSILNKRVIYIPPHLVSKIAEPDFLTFLLNENDFILIIEDAEEIITNREDTNNVAGVSNLLNLSDGILGDCLKVKIICTFNCELKDIDPALLRKGRLKLDYEFKKLEPVYANKLLKHLGFNYETKEAMSLAEIYSYDKENYRKEKEKGQIGFGK